MKRRRRCLACGALFMPDARVGRRQKACGQPECQRERHRRACKAWRQREQQAVREDRLRRRLGAPNKELRLDVVRDECGPKIKVVIQECLRLVVEGARDEFQTKLLEQHRESFRLVNRTRRDETDARGPAP
jgi:hypothetical protein